MSATRQQQGAPTSTSGGELPLVRQPPATLGSGEQRARSGSGRRRKARSRGADKKFPEPTTCTSRADDGDGGDNDDTTHQHLEGVLLAPTGREHAPDEQARGASAKGVKYRAAVHGPRAGSQATSTFSETPPRPKSSTDNRTEHQDDQLDDNGNTPATAADKTRGELERPLLGAGKSPDDKKRPQGGGAASKPLSAIKPSKLAQMSGELAERKWSQSSASQTSSSSALGTSRRSSSSCMNLTPDPITGGAQDRAKEEEARTTRDGATSGGGHSDSKRYDFNERAVARSLSSSVIDCSSLLEHDEDLLTFCDDHDGDGEHKYKAGLPLSASRRTISESMLALDAHLNCDKFEVYWRELSFAYERPWLSWTRSASKLATTCLSFAARENSQTWTGCRQDDDSQLVLKRLSGGFRSNELVAIIGPSGCGKTTLLQFLAGNSGGSASSRARMRIRGLAEPKVAHIGQDDALLPGLTARETLVYASRLQNTRANFDHAAHVEPILAQLGLSECADRSVSKLSGGQAKRVTIAQELLYPTNLLILDEVTSGLDASTSYSIVRLLKRLVSDTRYPMSIVMSIHQPSARLFSVFDRVYVMSEGECLYEGSCEPAAINAHLQRFQLECPRYHNIADYLIELACGAGNEQLGAPDKQVFSPFLPDQVEGTGSFSSASSIKAQMIELRHKSLESSCGGGGGGDRNSTKQVGQNPLHSPAELEHRIRPKHLLDQSLYLAIERARRLKPRPFLEQFGIHFGRSLMRIRRSYILTYLQLATYVLLGLQLATFYGPTIGTLSGCPRLPANLMSYVLTSGSGDSGGGGTGNETDTPAQGEDELTLEMRRIQENMNFLLVTVMTATFAALEITVITFPLEAKTVKREWRNGWYRVSSYFMGRTLADLPFQLAFVLIFCALIYLMTGQLGLGTWRFGSFVATLVMTALIAQSLGFIFGAIFMDNLPAAVFTAPLAIFPTLLFSGFFSRVSQIPPFYKPLTYLSHFRYAFDALLVTLYGYDRCQCDQASLTHYHANLRNQTTSMRDMFGLLFGASDCIQASGSAPELVETTTLAPHAGAESSEIVSREDLAAIRASNSTLASQMLESMASAPQALPVGGVHASALKPLEDALLDSVFAQMAHNNATNGSLDLLHDTSAGSGETSVMDRLAEKFATRLTTMLNRQSNFGHDVPRECTKFNSYLMTEFDLRNDDLISGLAMLLVVLLVTRVLCNLILNFTIARR